MGTSGTAALDAGRGSGEGIVISRGQDRAVAAVAMTIFAVSLSHAVDINGGQYWPSALFWLTVGAAFCVFAVVNPRWDWLEGHCRRWLPLILALSIADQAYYLLHEVSGDQIVLAFGTITFLGLIQFFEIGRLRWPLMLIMVLAFCVAGKAAMNAEYRFPPIDVYFFQSGAAHAVLHGMNPYTLTYPNVYLPDTPFYGPGIVTNVGVISPELIQLWHQIFPHHIDAMGRYPIGSPYQQTIGQTGTLTVGCPYPPLSVLLTIPGYLAGDVRFSHLLAMGLSAALIVVTRPNRVAALAATFLLLMPRALFVLELSWTEPLLVLTFSLVMFCACRWPKGLPIALGLYLSTKQYTVLTLPLLPLLVDGPRHWRAMGRLLLKAGIVVAVINLPFLLWNAHAFVRALVVFQFLQSFRNDALSYLVFIRRIDPGVPLPVWVALLPLVVMIPLCLRRVASSPAGFAAAVTAVHLFFFAFNKQAFCNYYYFVIATACWAIGAGVFSGAVRKPTTSTPAGIPGESDGGGALV